MTTVIYSVTGVFLIILGLLVKKYPNLIAGYNSLTPEQKEKVNIKKLSSLVRNSFIGMGLIIIWLDYLMKYIGYPEYTFWIFVFTVILGTGMIVVKAQKYS